MSLEEAIKIIQINERGRQGRQKAKEARELKSQERLRSDKQPSGRSLNPVEASILIQKT